MCVEGNNGGRPAVKNHKWYAIDFVLCHLGNGDQYEIFNLNIDTALSFTKLLHSQLEKQLDLLHLLKKCASCYCPSLHLPCPTRQLITMGSEIRVIYPLKSPPFLSLDPYTLRYLHSHTNTSYTGSGPKSHVTPVRKKTGLSKSTRNTTWALSRSAHTWESLSTTKMETP